MSDGSARPNPETPAAGGATAVKARRSWRVPVDKDPERPDYAVVRRLVLGSALMLFLELALIRWLGSNVVHLSYFSNFVLLGSFLGIGLGFLISKRSWSVLPAAPIILYRLARLQEAKPIRRIKSRLRSALLSHFDG